VAPNEEDQEIINPETARLLNQIPEDARKAIDLRIESLLSGGKSENSVTEEDFEELMKGVPQEVREALGMVGIGGKHMLGAPMTEEELTQKLPSDLSLMVAKLSPEKKQALLAMNQKIGTKLKDLQKAGVKFDMDEEIRKTVKDIYDEVFEVTSGSAEAPEDVRAAVVKDYASTVANVQILNQRMIQEAKSYKNTLKEYQNLKKELDEELSSDPMYQLQSFKEKSLPQKAALVLAIMISNNAVYQLIKTVQGRDGSVLLAATELLVILGFMYFYGIFGKIKD